VSYLITLILSEFSNINILNSLTLLYNIHLILKKVVFTFILPIKHHCEFKQLQENNVVKWQPQGGSLEFQRLGIQEPNKTLLTYEFLT
jgi:hypothetical protein